MGFEAARDEERCISVTAGQYFTTDRDYLHWSI